MANRPDNLPLEQHAPISQIDKLTKKQCDAIPVTNIIRAVEIQLAPENVSNNLNIYSAPPYSGKHLGMDRKEEQKPKGKTNTCTDYQRWQNHKENIRRVKRDINKEMHGKTLEYKKNKSLYNPP
jgi:hypothetical protein